MALNEGRGANPGDTWTDAGSNPLADVAQRRPGREPRRHRRRHAACGAVPGPLNEGRGANPGDTCAHRAPDGGDGPPLNEGRGANPGDTSCARIRPRSCSVRSTKAGARTPATLEIVRAQVAPLARSTKAGARTPATPLHLGTDGKLQDRSTKAGARTPATRGRSAATVRRCMGAQRRPGREPRRHIQHRAGNERRLGRSTKAGARTPATPARRPAAPSRPRPLNEGRGANPGDTCEQRVQLRLRQGDRSTKAGARTPATLRRSWALPEQVTDRSTKAGARTPATLGDLIVWAIGLVRSTKAGARTPATLRGWTRCPSSCASAQRRPGREPRRHLLIGATHVCR